ncbi:MAG: hypothetical protein E5V58_03055 [Mesorhizobium sp.]|nr:MAG: hypothetical protein E5V58_03055 [Mesorhizobium sp.]
MSEKSAAELERDADIARAKVVDTADSIRSRMTPGQLIDEFAGMFAGGEGAAMLGNLKAQVRDNPLPLTLVGAGLAWLMLGNGASATNPAAGNQTGMRPSDSLSDRPVDELNEDSEGSGIAAVLSDTADSVASAAGDAFTTAANAATGAMEGITGSAGQLGSSASEMTARARQSAQDLLEREPLAVAAVGLALGAALGAMLPRTATEDEQIGGYSDKLRDTAEKTFETGLEQVKQVAAEAYDTVKEEADRQGSGGDAAPLAGQVGKVVKSTVEKTEEAIRDRLPESSEGSSQGSS